MTVNDWKWCGKKWSWPNLKNYPGKFLERIRTMKTSVRIIGVLVNIRTGCFPNTNQKHFCLKEIPWIIPVHIFSPSSMLPYIPL
jgi:hypothetical protein